MRILTTLLFLNFGVLTAASGQHSGIISRQEDGSYKCAFPEKNIIILFHKHPNIPGLENFKPEILNELERNDFARIISISMNLLPAKTLNMVGAKYIYPMHLGRRNIYSLHFGPKILIDGSDLQPGMNYDQHLAAAFLYEIGVYLLATNTHSEKLSNFLNLLTQYYNTGTSSKEIQEMADMLPYGFVTYRSLGRWSGQYDPRIEFSELFSYLIRPETNKEVTQFVTKYPESGLAQKVQQFFDCLIEIDPAFATKIPSPEEDPTDVGLVVTIDGQELLNAHEYRSNQVFGNFSQFDVTETRKSVEEVYIHSSSQEFKTAEEASINSEPTNFTFSYNETINVNDRQSDVKQQNYIAQRKKGRGAWVWVVLGLVLLGLAGG